MLEESQKMLERDIEKINDEKIYLKRELETKVNSMNKCGT